MVIKKTIGSKIFDLINYLVLFILAFICFYPLLYSFAASFSDPGMLTSHQGPLLFPVGFTLKGYELVFKNPNIAMGYKNTIIYLVTGTLVNLFMTSLGAYVLSRKNVMFIKPLMFLITFTMYFSGGLVPWYMLIVNLGWINTIWAMIIPGAISTYNLIIMRTSFKSIPDSLEESAMIDGANDFTVLWKIILPVSKPVIAVMVLFYAVGHWNSWFNAMIFLKDRDLFPIQLIMRQILIDNDKFGMMQQMMTPQETSVYKSLIQYCTIIVGTMPILLVYPFLQKYFTKGIMIGSLKE